MDMLRKSANHLLLFLCLGSGAVFGMEYECKESVTPAKKPIDLTHVEPYEYKDVGPVLYEAMDQLPREMIELVLAYYDYNLVKKIKGVCVRTFRAHSKAVTCLVALMNGGFASSYEEAKTVSLWDAQGKPVRMLKTAATEIHCLLATTSSELVAGGYLLVPGAAHCKVAQGFNPDTGKETKKITDGDGEVYCMAELKNGWVALGLENGVIELRHCATQGKSEIVLHDVHTPIVVIKTLSQGGFVVASKSGVVALFNQKHQLVAHKFLVPIVSMKSSVVGFREYNNFVYAVTSVGAMYQLTHKENKFVLKNVVNDRMRIRAMVPLALQKYGLISHHGAVLIYNHSDEKFEKNLHHEEACMACVLPSSGCLVTGSSTGEVKMWN